MFLSAGSLAIPFVLDWRKEIAPLPPLFRQLFWTYAGYILGIHVFFGLISILAPGELIAGSTLSISLCVFIALYWLVRLIIQFAVFEVSEHRKTKWHVLGEVGLVGLFVFFTVVYTLAALYQI